MLRAKETVKAKKARQSALAFGVTVILVFILLLLVKNSYKTTTVLVTTMPIKQGTMITKEMFRVEEVGQYGLSSNVVKNGEMAIGKYALRDYNPEEFLFGTSLSENYLQRLSERARYGAIAVPISTINSVGGDIRPDDFVGVLISMSKGEDENYGQASSELPTSRSATIYSKELVAVRVLGMYNNKAELAGDATKTRTSDASYIEPTMIVFDALPIQRILLNQARDNGSIRLIIQPERIQEEYRKKWGLGPAFEGQEKDSEEELLKSIEESERIEQGHNQLNEEYGGTAEEMEEEMREVTNKNINELKVDGKEPQDIKSLGDEFNNPDVELKTYGN